MISAGDFKRNYCRNRQYCLHYSRFSACKTGKGAALYKLKNIMTGRCSGKNLQSHRQACEDHVETKEMQYLYNDGELYYFMDMETYEQIPLNRSQVEMQCNITKENSNAIIKFFQGSAFL